MAKQAVRTTTKSCDYLALPGAARPTMQRHIAARAFEMWLARGFRDGSPQEELFAGAAGSSDTRRLVG